MAQSMRIFAVGLIALASHFCQLQVQATSLRRAGLAAKPQLSLTSEALSADGAETQTIFNTVVAAAAEYLFSSDAQAGGYSPFVEEVTKHMRLEDAERVVVFPADVTAVLAASGTSKKRLSSGQPVALSPEALDRSVATLNRMAHEAQERLDLKVIDCKTFKTRSQQNRQQIAGDLTRFGQVVADLQRMKSKAMAGIEELSVSTQQLKEEQAQARAAFNETKTRDLAQLSERKHDLEAVTMMLKITACPGSLLQGGRLNGTSTSSATSTELESCSDGAVNFKDANLQKTFRSLTAGGQKLTEFALSRSGATDPNLVAVLRTAGLAMSGPGSADLEDGEEGEPEPSIPVRKPKFDPAAFSHATYPSSPKMVVEQTTSTPAPRSFQERLLAERQGRGGAVRGSLTERTHVVRQAPAMTAAPAAPAAEVDAGKQSRKCVKAEADCGLLHDTFAQLWGDATDLVGASEAKLREDETSMKELETRVNMQIQAFTMQKGDLQSQLAEASSTMAAEVEGQTQKSQQADQMAHLYHSTMQECERTIKQILFVELCGIIKVRNAIMEQAKRPKATDCQVTEWVPGQCSKTCDDTLLGGNMTLRREIITAPVNGGTACPELNMTIPCNQIACPVDCQISQWSSWSKCTKDCGGGVQARSRSQLTKPRNGGQACDALQESRACNTGSCDKNCKLSEWSEYGDCTQACDGGYRESKRTVIHKKVGAGTCPAESSPARYQKELCNQQACVGDETCIGKRDVVIAIDASGSVTEKGFDIFKKFAAGLVRRFRASAYGKEAMRVGVVQFGNGALGKDNVVSDALVVSALSDQVDAVATSIEGMTYKRGFTNIAQALIKAKDLFGSGREDAARTVVLVTDGRPTFKKASADTVRTLRESAKLVVVHVKGFPSSDDKKLLKSYASVPSASNYLWIPGKKTLKGAVDSYISKTLVQLCSHAESPSALKMAAETQGFKKIRVGVNCGPGAATSVKASLVACKSFAADHATTAKTTWAAFAYSDSGACIVYDSACVDFSRNTSFSVYEPVTTAQQKMLAR